MVKRAAPLCGVSSTSGRSTAEDVTTGSAPGSSVTPRLSAGKLSFGAHASAVAPHVVVIALREADAH